MIVNGSIVTRLQSEAGVAKPNASPDHEPAGRTANATISRRGALSSLGSAGAYFAAPYLAFAASESEIHPNHTGDGPTFDPRGPDAKLYGIEDGYPVPGFLRAVWEGNPWPPKYRVGAFSHYHEIFRTARVPRASSPWSFRRRTADLKFTYHFRGSESSLRDYVSRNPVTGLLIAKDEEILFEHYQYGLNDHHQMMSQSIAKSITGLLVGLAVADGVIKSVDDTAGVYVPGLRGSEYGNTPIRDLLHMSSGVDFGEERDGGRDLDRLWIDMVLRRWPFNKGTVESIRQFNNRVAPPGTRFYYASIETDVLGLVVHHAVGKSLSDYIYERIWSQIGAEADAAWLVDADGFEVAHGFFNAVLRDYARLARLLAHDGAWEGKQIIPSQWMIDATTVRPSDSHLAPGKATSDFGYGYQVWLLPGARRQFALLGFKGQRICIDPISKVMMVHTALEEGEEIWTLWSSLVEQFG
jgi:CubicO group peptidase (beta-lactamase class C family)